MRAIAVGAIAALLTGCAMTPDEIRLREPAASGVMNGDEATAIRCVGRYLAGRNIPGGWVPFQVTADMLGVKAYCQGPVRVCVLVDFRTVDGRTIATSCAVGAGVAFGMATPAREAIDACRAPA